MNIKRRYFEIWGDLEAQNNTLKFILSVCFVLLGVALCIISVTSLKPPVVIRVSDIGKAEAVTDYPVNNSVSRPELLFFAKLFVKKFTAYNSYTISSDMADAFGLMTARFQREARKEVLDSHLVSKISESGVNTDIEIREVKIEREDESHTVLSLIGLRTIMNYQNRAFKEESLFKGELALKKVPRTMASPQGLLVEEYREILVKQIDK